MLKEILEQPQTLSDFIGQCLKDKQDFCFKLNRGERKKFDEILKNTSSLFILACGSSYHAALFAKYLLEEVAGVQVHAEIASEFIYRKAVIPPDTPVLLISQSGETADILTALKQVKSLGLKSISLHNTISSSLDRKSDFSIPLLAGPEVAVASTKTFSSSLMALSF